MRHRRTVVIGWILIAVLATAAARVEGSRFANVFSLPGTESQRVVDLLGSQFKAQSGDSDQIVFHYANGHYDAPHVKAAITPLLAHVATMPHVASVVSPYSAQGAVQVSADRQTAFATIQFDQRANVLPNDTGKPILNAIDRVHVQGLQVAAGGQVIANAEAFSIGPATAVGVVAALAVLLFTFGSLIAAGLPLITAAIGLLVGLALVELATHVMSVPNIASDLALMIGLGVGVDYALFIVTRFKESYSRNGNVEAATLEAMDTSGRAIVLAGITVVIALLGMFVTGVEFMYGLAVASVLAVLLVLAASLTVVPALLSRFGERVAGRRARADAIAAVARIPGGAALDLDPTPPPVTAGRRSLWRRWSGAVQRRPWAFAVASLAIMLVFVSPVLSMQLESSDSGNDPAGSSTRQAYDMLARGFGAGFNGPLVIAVELSTPAQQRDLATIRTAVAGTADVVAVGMPQLSPSGKVAVLTAYPRSAPEAQATADLVNRLRNDVLPPVDHRLGVRSSVGGATAGSIDFSSVLSARLPVFIAVVVVLSALLLFVIFRSLVIPVQAALMNLLSIGGSLGATVAVFQHGWLGGVIGIQAAPIEPWIPLITFAVVFGLSMDYEVFLISRVREQWKHGDDAATAVADGLAFTGRVITAAATIMVLVFLSFLLSDERAIKEFGFGLAVAVFLDAIVVRCVLVPAVLHLVGENTWRLPAWIDGWLPRVNIEGSTPASGRTSVAGPTPVGEE